MKRFALYLIGLILCLANGFSQTPPISINYQGVARSNDGSVLTNAPLDFRFSILQDNQNGTAVWVEEHTSVITNNGGVFKVSIGLGTRLGGTCNTFDQINWGAHSYYLRTEIKVSNNYSPLGGASLITWVPYALYALKAGSGSGNISATFDANSKTLTINDANIDLSSLAGTANAITNISVNNNQLVYTKNGSDNSIDLGRFLDNTDNQNLSLNGQVLRIANGNEVTLPTQTLSIEQNTLRLSNGGGSVNIDPSPENEIQFLRINADTIELYRPGLQKADSKVVLHDLFEERDTVYIKGFPKPRKISLRNELSIPQKNTLAINRGNSIVVDTDTTNEIQNLKLTGDILKITNNAAATEINLAPYKDNTDNQAISRTGNVIQITGNTSTVDISDMINVPWVGFSANNLSGQSLQGANTETLLTWSEEFDHGNCIENNIFIANSGGVYNFALTTQIATQYSTVRIYKNNVIYRFFENVSGHFNYNFLLVLNANDQISIKVVNPSAFTTNVVYGYFSGYRVH